MKYRTLFISDLHLGTPHSAVNELMEFLKQNEFEMIYIVGDLIDFWQLKRKHYWPQTHNDVIQKLLRKSRKGTKIIYIPGNHDEFMSEFIGQYGNISIVKQAIHTTVTGSTYAVVHGHEFDLISQNIRWVSVLGDVGYQILLALNRPINWFRRVFRFEPWSLSAYVKNRTKMIVNFVGKFETAIVHFAQLHNTDGIICGHIHCAANRTIGGYEYWNTGDWVESKTAIVEHLNGRMEIVQ